MSKSHNEFHDPQFQKYKTKPKTLSLTVAYITRMHFSRMRTVRCSGRRGEGTCITACTAQGSV